MRSQQSRYPLMRRSEVNNQPQQATVFLDADQSPPVLTVKKPDGTFVSLESSGESPEGPLEFQAEIHGISLSEIPVSGSFDLVYNQSNFEETVNVTFDDTEETLQEKFDAIMEGFTVSGEPADQSITITYPVSLGKVDVPTVENNDMVDGGENPITPTISVTQMGGLLGMDASTTTYTPGDANNWAFASGEPENVQQALDSVAEKITNTAPVFLNLNSEARTFNQGVGSITLLYKSVSNTSGGIHTIEIPAGTTADGGGAVITSNAIFSNFRPDADISFPCIVIDNGVRVFGKVKIGSNGIITFSVGANDGTFTDNAAAGWDRITVTYGI